MNINSHKRSVSDIPLESLKRNSKRTSITPNKTKNINKDISCRSSILDNFKKKENNLFNVDFSKTVLSKETTPIKDLHSRSFLIKKNSQFKNNLDISEISKKNDLDRSKISDNSLSNLKQTLNNYDTSNKRKNSFMVGGFMVDLNNKKIISQDELKEEDSSLLPLNLKDNCDDSLITNSTNVFQNLKENLNDKKTSYYEVKSPNSILHKDNSIDLSHKLKKDLSDENLSYMDTTKGMKSIKSTKKKFERSKTPRKSQELERNKSPLNNNNTQRNYKKISSYDDTKKDIKNKEPEIKKKYESRIDPSKIKNSIFVRKEYDISSKKDTHNSEKENHITVKKEPLIIHQEEKKDKPIKKKDSYNGIIAQPKKSFETMNSLTRSNIKKNKNNADKSKSPIVKNKFF